MSKEEFWQLYKWSLTDGLFVPETPIPSGVQTISSNILQDTTGTAITHEAVFGNIISPADITNLVKSISCTNWLLFLSKITSALWGEHKYNVEAQRNLARLIFPDNTFGKVEELLQGNYNGIPINTWQISSLAKMALLESKLDSDNSNELIDMRETIAKCLCRFSG